MPSVDVAMARSLRGGVWGSIAQSLGSALTRRDTIGDVQAKAGEAVNAFSSWDNCMQVTYCKWPVIAMIIIAGLIIFSIIWCIVRCACCGLSCCCSCCQCLKCCGQCCGMCDPPKGRAHRYLDNETLPPTQGYRSEPPMKAPILSPVRPTATVPPPEPPQYAEFDVSRKGGEDSLPVMPTWENANSKKIVLEEESVEMDQLKKPEASGAVAAAAIPGPSNHASPAVSPGSRSPYGQPSPAGSNGYLPQGQRVDPYAGQDQGYGYNNGGYGGPSSSSLAVDQYGAAGAAMGPGRRSPHHQDYNGYGQNQMDQGYGSRSHSPHAYGSGHGHSPQPQGQGYARRPSPPRQNTYASEQPMRHSPAPQADYGYDQHQQHQQQYPQAGGYGLAYPPQPQTHPQRQYSGDSRVPMPRASPNPEAQYTDAPETILNNSGFDFNSGYSRPQQLNNYGRRPSAPQHQQSNNSGYTAYRPYQPPQQGGY